MKSMKRVLALVLALVMCLGLATVAMATDAKPTTATITVTNAAKGETYTIYKLFDASVSGAEDGSISYTGTIPDSLKSYFTTNKIGYIIPTDAAKTDAEGKTLTEECAQALKAWAEGQGASYTRQEKEWEGGPLAFTGLEFGYYVLLSSQGEKTAVSVDSTNPNAEVYDKNTPVPSGFKKEGEVNGETKEDVSIGDVVTYTLSFTASNYNGTGKDAKLIEKYIIKDTLPEFLSNVQVTSVTVDEKAVEPTPGFVNKQMELTWQDADGKPLYTNGAEVVITYTAEINDKLPLGSATGGKNTAELSWEPKDGTATTPEPVEVTVKSYGLAIQKVDETGAPLPGGKFSLAGVEAKKAADGNYTVTKVGADVTATVMECDEDGRLVVMGLAQGKYTLTEEEAPAGYNKLKETKEISAVVTETVSIKQYLDENGNVDSEETDTVVNTPTEALLEAALKVENSKGTNLPSTGGIGTTIFYVIGGSLVVGAGVLLVTKKRMAHHD